MGYEAGPLRMPLTEMEPEHARKLGEAMQDFGISLRLKGRGAAGAVEIQTR